MKRDVILLAHNIRSLWNVGAFFRTADCFGVREIVLAGYTPVPPRREISKTALGAEKWIQWRYSADPLDVIAAAKKDSRRIVALEDTANAVDLGTYSLPEKLLLIAGHEVLGVPDMLLSEADDVVRIPMHGNKESLNVAVAVGIALERFANA